MSQDLSQPSLAAPDETSVHRDRLSWAAAWVGLASAAAIAVAAICTARGHFGFDLYLPTLCFLVCLLGAWYDAGTGHIPNPLTYTAVGVGLGAHVMAGVAAWWLPHSSAAGMLGLSPINDALAGFAVCAAIGLCCQALAGMGGGDMKLLAAAGALLGFHAVWPMLLWALVVALPYSLLNLVLFGGLNAVARTVSLQLLALIYLRELPPKEPVSKRTIPLGVPLLLGLLMSRLLPANQWLWS